jgi:glutamate-5-semialdehyde dehydrogenase
MNQTDLVLQKSLTNRLEKLKKNALKLGLLNPENKNNILLKLEQLLEQNAEKLFSYNMQDCELFKKNPHFTQALLDRLTLTPQRLKGILESLRQVREQKDLVGEVFDRRELANGLIAERVRAPLGTIFMIFESRPNVVIEAFSLALKSGNALILKGGKESSFTVEFMYGLINEALGNYADSFWGLENHDLTISRQVTDFLIRQDQFIDVLIPRGGEALIEYVKNNSRIPLIKNDRGLCHVYIGSDANYKMSEEIVINSKTQRPSVCNAMETLLVDKNWSTENFKNLIHALQKAKVSIMACEKTVQKYPELKLEKANAESFRTEYLDLVMNLKIVENVEEAIEHISEYGSHHSEAIITENKLHALHFQKMVDAAAVYWNASTRFTDGFELGLGGEMGISTQKLHVRGPVGLEHLTCLKWCITGTGQIRK